MTVIPLISALYDMPTGEAKMYVNWSTANFRQSDRNSRFSSHLPETPAQNDKIAEIEPLVRKHTR